MDRSSWSNVPESSLIIMINLREDILELFREAQLWNRFRSYNLAIAYAKIENRKQYKRERYKIDKLRRISQVYIRPLELVYECKCGERFGTVEGLRTHRINHDD